MHIFVDVFLRLMTIYVLIVVGYISGRWLKLNRETVAALLIYVLSPGLIFYGILRAELTAGLLVLPLVFLVLSSFIGTTFYVASKPFLRGPARNVLGLAAGTANTGYFGLPVVILLFGDQALSIVIFSMLGFAVFGNTLGFFLVARGKFSVHESLRFVLHLPAVYAVIVGLAVNLLGVKPGVLLSQMGTSFQGAYSVLGVMMIGLALGAHPSFHFDWSFIAWSFAAKFVAWPVVVLLIVWVDQAFFRYFDHLTHEVMVVLSAVPLATDTVSIASLLDTEPEKAAMAVLLSTALSVFLIPLVVGAFHMV